MGRRRAAARPVIVNLSSLWAGPLAARLLQLRGARVIKVEAPDRPDGLRTGAPRMFADLHDGQVHVTVDFRRESGRLIDLLLSADLVIESSRPRALEQLGIRAADFVAEGISWLSITARGRASDAVGFGDDVAATAGMVLADQGCPVPVGDALADPLTGLTAAVAATRCLGSEQAQLLDVSMLHVVAGTVGPIPDHRVFRTDAGWSVESAGGCTPVAGPSL